MAEEQRRDGVIEFPHPRLTAGGRLRAAREAAGLSLADMAAQTKISTRMLTLIEGGDYAALPAKAYATGFTRTYARALGLDEAEILAEVRRELGQADPVENRFAPTFEPGDLSRVPSARFAWLAGVAALIVLAAGLLLWRSYYAPAVTLPPLTEPPVAPSPVAAPAPGPIMAPRPEPSMQVPTVVASAPAGAAAGPQLRPRPAPRPGTDSTPVATTPAGPTGGVSDPSAGAAAADAAVAATPALHTSPTSTTP